MPLFNLYKASGQEDTVLVINKSSKDVPMQDSINTFRKDGETIFNILVHAVPGDTYERIKELILERENDRKHRNRQELIEILFEEIRKQKTPSEMIDNLIQMVMGEDK